MARNSRAMMERIKRRSPEEQARFRMTVNNVARVVADAYSTGVPNKQKVLQGDSGHVECLGELVPCPGCFFQTMLATIEWMTEEIATKGTEDPAALVAQVMQRFDQIKEPSPKDSSEAIVDLLVDLFLGGGPRFQMVDVGLGDLLRSRLRSELRDSDQPLH